MDENNVPRSPKTRIVHKFIVFTKILGAGLILFIILLSSLKALLFSTTPITDHTAGQDFHQVINTLQGVIDHYPLPMSIEWNNETTTTTTKL